MLIVKRNFTMQKNTFTDKIELQSCLTLATKISKEEQKLIVDSKC